MSFYLVSYEHMNPGNIYLFKDDDRNSKLTIKTPDRRHWRRSGDFLLLTVNIFYTFL